MERLIRIQNKGLQKDAQDKLYRVLEDYIPKTVVTNKNKSGSWKYGYDPKYDVVVISKTGQIGEVVSIQGLPIALPKAPKECRQRHSKKSEQYWERLQIPKELNRIQSIFQWNEQHATFKNR